MEVIRTDRKKSASIGIVDGLVKVRVPRSLSDKRVRSLIAERSAWIKAKLREESERPAPKPKEYVSGEAFAYLGRNYRLKVQKGDAPSIKMKGGYLVTTVTRMNADPQQTIKPLLEDWYRSHAQFRLAEKTGRLAKMVGVKPRSVSVRDYKARWGSCSSRGDITYNWKIILAPHRIVDYVVVHELCHLLEHNHSPRYWKHVERHVPDWKARRDWLKANPPVF